MSAGLDRFAQRRADLLVRLDQDRTAVANAFSAVEGRMRVAEVLVGMVRKANRHRALAGTLAAVAIIAPFAARKWLKRAAWLLPLVVEGIRLVRGKRDDRRETGSVGDD